MSLTVQGSKAFPGLVTSVLTIVVQMKIFLLVSEFSFKGRVPDAVSSP